MERRWRGLQGSLAVNITAKEKIGEVKLNHQKLGSDLRIGDASLWILRRSPIGWRTFARTAVKLCDQMAQLLSLKHNQ